MRRFRARLAVPAMVAPLALVSAAPAAADSGNAAASFGLLYHDGAIVRTVVTPTSTPGKGVDAIFAFATGVDGQLSVTSVAPGSPGYHGGRWAVYLVSWNTTPRLLTSDEAVAAANTTGEVTITRMPAADFVCPVAGQPPAR
jgi:hypothetical protein